MIKAAPARIKATSKVLPDRVVLAIGERRDAIIEVIRSARKDLLISLFRCTDVKILDAIGEARSRDVDVRLILTPRARGWEKRLKELSAYLESMGVEVHPYSDPVVKYHAKYLIADGRQGLVASLNMTAKCFAATCDFLLVTHDPAVISGLQDLFETDWLAPHSSFPSAITPRLIVGPDRARAQFTALLESARRSIQIIDHKMRDSSIEKLLKSKRSAGVNVQILEPGQFGGLLPHGKLMIIDGKVAAFGSMPLSPLGLDFRREVSVIVDDPKSVRKLKNFFGHLASGLEFLPPGVAEQFLREE